MFLMLLQIAVKKQAAILTLSSICNLGALALATAGAAWFYALCKEKGMIARKIDAVLTYWLLYKTRPRYIRATLVEYAYHYPEADVLRDYGPGVIKRFLLRTRRAAWAMNLYKVLGGCIWCFGVWVAAFFYVGLSPYLGLTGPLLLWLFIPYIGLNYFFMELINKIRA